MDLHMARHVKRLIACVEEEVFDLRSHVFPHHVNPSRRVVRKTQPKLHQPKLNLADYIEREAQPPTAVHRSHLGNPRLADPLGNTDWGDCGEAMALHGIEAFHLDAATPVPPFVTNDALDLYTAVSGFDPSRGGPGQNPTDVGTDNAQLVKTWENPGVHCRADGSRHQIAGSLFVDPHDDVATRLGIWEFVVVFRALGLPITAQTQSEWSLVDPTLQGDSALGSWGYHDIPQFSYDSTRIRIDTWGEELLEDWAFDKAYAVQGLVVVTKEMLDLRGISPAGINWTRLNADLLKLPPGDAS